MPLLAVWLWTQKMVKCWTTPQNHNCAYRLIPKVALDPRLTVCPRNKNFHQLDISFHGGVGARSNLSDPDGLAKLLIQAGCLIYNGLKVGCVGVVAQCVDGVPCTCR